MLRELNDTELNTLYGGSGTIYVTGPSSGGGDPRGSYSTRGSGDATAREDAQRAAEEAAEERKGALERAEEIANEELARTRALTANLGPNAGHNDIYDAERHARWVYRMATELGPNWADAISTAHEYDGMLKGQPMAEFRMDTNNNHVGLDHYFNDKGIPTRDTPGLVVLDSAGNYPG